MIGPQLVHTSLIIHSTFLKKNRMLNTAFKEDIQGHVFVFIPVL